MPHAVYYAYSMYCAGIPDQYSCIWAFPMQTRAGRSGSAAPSPRRADGLEEVEAPLLHREKDLPGTVRPRAQRLTECLALHYHLQAGEPAMH
jgi:hypothetical protein